MIKQLQVEGLIKENAFHNKQFLQKGVIYELGEGDIKRAAKQIVESIPTSYGSGKLITRKEAIDRVFDWIKSDNCWITDKNGKPIEGAMINGQNLDKI